jgi:ABC-type nitrate/sulfonate/bicarbonate transport system permease component
MNRSSWRLDTCTRDRLLSIGFPLALLALWETAVRLQWLDGRFFPAPTAVAVALWESSGFCPG